MDEEVRRRALAGALGEFIDALTGSADESSGNKEMLLLRRVLLGDVGSVGSEEEVGENSGSGADFNEPDGNSSEILDESFVSLTLGNSPSRLSTPVASKKRTTGLVGSTPSPVTLTLSLTLTLALTLNLTAT